MKIQIVPMEREHLPQVAALEDCCFSMPWSEALLARELEQNTTEYRVALDETGDVLGYAGFYTVLDEGCITNVAVWPAHRRQGIGKKLMEALAQAAEQRKLSLLTLEVRAGNKEAIGLYQAYGFQAVGIRKKYYEHPVEDAILMTRSFAGIEA